MEVRIHFFQEFTPGKKRFKTKEKDKEKKMS